MTRIPDNVEKGRLLKAEEAFDVYEMVWNKGAEDETVLSWAYTKEGLPIDSWEAIKPLFLKYSFNQFSVSGDSICAYSDKNKKWYGWSHRAIHGFGRGDIVEEGDVVVSEGVPIGFEVKNDNDAKYLAKKFSKAVATLESFIDNFSK